MKSISLSRRGLLVGAAAATTSASAAAEDRYQAITFTEEEGTRAAGTVPPYAYAGCYTGGSNARGISVFSYNLATNALTDVGIMAPVTSPSFIVLDAPKKFLYSGNESGGGSVSSFAVNPQTGALRFLNTQGAGGQPAHISIHPGGKYLLSANYTGGTVAVFPIQADGSLAAASQIVTHFGELGANSGRQEAPHPHMILCDSTGKYALVNDLALDATIIYSFDATGGKLTEVGRVAAASGSGPRHLAWHPAGSVLYSINEMLNTLNVYRWDGNGGLVPIQENVSTLPTGFRGNSGAGEVLVDAAGKFLYASNRGNDNIGIFSIDPATFQLKAIDWVHTRGRTPRHFNFDPTGNMIFACNQDSANIVAFKVDKTTGMLSSADLYVGTVAPTCIQFGFGS